MSDDSDFDMEVVDTKTAEDSSSDGGQQASSTGKEKKQGYTETPSAKLWPSIPEDWEMVAGNAVYDANPTRYAADEEVDYIEMDALKTDLSDPKYVGRRDPSDYSGQMFAEGDTLFAQITPCTENGKAALVPELESPVGIGSTEFIVLSPDETKILPRYLYYLSKSHPVHNYAVSRMRGSTGRQRVPVDVFRKELQAPLPPLPEQRKIASVLYAVDQAIQKTEAIIEQAKRVKQGLMQDLFETGYYDHSICERRIGPQLRKVPESWDVIGIGELAEYQNGYGFSKDEWSEQGRPIIRIQDLTRPEESDVNYFDGQVDEKYEVENGDVLVSWSATLGVFKWNRGSAVLNQHIFKVRNIKEFVDEGYLYYALNYALSELERKLHGSTMKHVTRSAFENTEVPLPGLDEQKKISRVLGSVDEEIRTEEAKKQNLEQVKKGLMQDLLTGEVRTADKAIEVLDEVAAHR